MKKILFVASECVPFVKTGGLADVVGALPKYFDKEKYEVRVILPNYRFIPAKWKERMQFVTSFYMDMAWRSQYVGIMEMEYAGFIIISSTMNIILMGINHMATSMKMWKSSHSFPERLCLSCQ